jgi:hypothetical protein
VAKVLDKEGHGAIINLISGLLWARASGAKVILTHLQAYRKDWHLWGIVRKVRKDATIIAVPPDEGDGEGFPLMVRDYVLFETMHRS